MLDIALQKISEWLLHHLELVPQSQVSPGVHLVVAAQPGDGVGVGRRHVFGPVFIKGRPLNAGDELGARLSDNGHQGGRGPGGRSSDGVIVGEVLLLAIGFAQQA